MGQQATSVELSEHLTMYSVVIVILLGSVVHDVQAKADPNLHVQSDTRGNDDQYYEYSSQEQNREWIWSPKPQQPPPPPPPPQNVQNNGAALTNLENRLTNKLNGIINRVDEIDKRTKENEQRTRENFDQLKSLSGR